MSYKLKGTVVLIDDHSLFLKGMTLLLKEILPGYEILAYSSIKIFMKNYHSLNSIELLISDIELPGENIFDFISEMKDRFSGLPILIISMHKKLSVIRKCKLLGVNGYILKDEDELLKEAVFKTMNGQTYYSPKVESFYRSADTLSNKLSSREEEIIKLIAKGLMNKDIAKQLFISVETVKTHKKNIKLKLGIENTAEIIKYAKINFLM